MITPLQLRTLQQLAAHQSLQVTLIRRVPRWFCGWLPGGRRPCFTPVFALKSYSSSTALPKLRPVELESISLLAYESYRRRHNRVLVNCDDLLMIGDALGAASTVLLVLDIDQDQTRLLYANKAGLGFLQLPFDHFTNDTSTTVLNKGISVALQCVVNQGPHVHERTKLKLPNQQDVTVQNMEVFAISTPAGLPLAHGIKFDGWVCSDGLVGLAGCEPINLNDLPSQEDVDMAADSVRQQADFVRHLKQDKGLGNQDEEVQQAVALLQLHKQRLGSLQQNLEHGKRIAALGLDQFAASVTSGELH